LSLRPDRMDFKDFCLSFGYPVFLVSAAGLWVKTQTNKYKHGNYWRDEFWLDDQKVVELDQEATDFIYEEDKRIGTVEYKKILAIVPRVPEGSIIKSDKVLGYLAW
jgi:hypothetical protein